MGEDTVIQNIKLHCDILLPDRPVGRGSISLHRKSPREADR